MQGQWYQDTRSYIIDFDERVAATVFVGAEPFVSLASSPVRPSAIATAQTVNQPPESSHTVRIAIANLFVGFANASDELFFRLGIDYMTGVFTGISVRAVARPRDQYTTAYAVRLGTRHEIPPIALPGSGAEAELKALSASGDDLGPQIQAMRSRLIAEAILHSFSDGKSRAKSSRYPQAGLFRAWVLQPRIFKPMTILSPVA